MTMGWLQETKDGVTLTVKAVPRVPGSCGSASFSDFIATGKTHSESIDEMLEFLSVFDARVIRFDVDAHIDRAILLPSNTTVYVDNCTIWQNDDVFDNVFRSANVRDLPSDDYAEMIAAHDKTPWTGYYEKLPSEIPELENIRILGLGKARIVGPQTNAVINNPVKGEDSLVGDAYGYRTQQIHIAKTNHAEVGDLDFARTRCWCVSFELSSDIHVHGLRIESHTTQGDGVDIRMGCRKVEIRDIEAFTSDDSIACTCVPHFDPWRRDPASPKMFCCESTRNVRGKMKLEEAHIADVHISDIVTDARAEVAHGVILLAALGGQVHHVSIDNVRELGRGMERESVIKVFTGYGDGYRPGDLHHIRVNNVTSEKARSAFQCNTHVADVRVNRIIQHAAGHSTLRPRLRIAALDAKYIEDIAFSNVEGGIVNNYGQ